VRNFKKIFAKAAIAVMLLIVLLSIQFGTVAAKQGSIERDKKQILVKYKTESKGGGKS
jgi:hypothetical protein